MLQLFAGQSSAALSERLFLLFKVRVPNCVNDTCVWVLHEILPPHQ